MLYKTPHRKLKDGATRTPLKTRDELRCCGRVSSSCSTSGTCGVTIVTTIGHKRDYFQKIYSTNDSKNLETDQVFIDITYELITLCKWRSSYYYYCHFLSKYHCFLQCKIIFFSKSKQGIRHQNHYNQLKYRYILHLRMNEILPKKTKYQ